MAMEEAFRLFKSTREYLTPVLTETQFLEKGMLTPEEFVRAGDHLVRSCPSWAWESGDKTKLRPYLPPNKQFLVTRGVPSYQRISSLQLGATYKEDAGDEGDWCHTQFSKGASEFTDDVLDMEFIEKDVELEGGPPVKSTATAAPPVPPKDEYLDMEDESLALDAATISAPVTSAQSLVKVRRYDVSITYDNYYRTPRIWLYGYDENGSSLTPEAVFDDVMQDYAKRTVTIDPHPHTSNPHASIHPCQHAVAMLNILNALKENGNTPTVEQYLFIFLKFIQSVVPTIEYDYTMDVQVRTSEK